MFDDLSDDDLRTISRGQCPKCKSRGFVMGPMQSGTKVWSTINVECANWCRARFNVLFHGGRALHGHKIPDESEGGGAWPSSPDNRDALQKLPKLRQQGRE